MGRGSAGIRAVAERRWAGATQPTATQRRMEVHASNFGEYLRPGTTSPTCGGAAMRRIATIGVYGFTTEAFIEKLADEDVALLLDLRQRRGVRGPDYAWANSARLQRT